MLKKLAWVSAYAISMAFIEAAVVVYLRGLLFYGSETVELGGYYRIEIGREAATLVMLMAVGWLAGRSWPERLAYGVYAFGLWDIGYYVWLKVTTGWPESFLSPDVLFLIPVRWTGPVLAPALIAALMCFGAVILLKRMEQEKRLHFPPLRIAMLGVGGALALFTFVMDTLLAYLQGNPDWNDLYPGTFHWPLFLPAFVLMSAPIFQLTFESKNKEKQA